MVEYMRDFIALRPPAHRSHKMHLPILQNSLSAIDESMQSVDERLSGRHVISGERF